MADVVTYQRGRWYELDVAITITDRRGEAERNENVTQQDKGGEWEADTNVRNI